MDLNNILGDRVDLSSGTGKSATHPESGVITVSPAYVSLGTVNLNNLKCRPSACRTGA